MSAVTMLVLFLLAFVRELHAVQTLLDNGVAGLPQIECMEDRLRLYVNTQRPFTGRIFVQGMVDKNQCVKSFAGNTGNKVSFDLMNGECNMRRTRRLGPQERGIEQSITVIISFHDTFITKIDKAFRTTCFYMEADKVVTSQFDVSQIPTTDIVDTAQMPQCSYSVRRDSITGPIVQYAVVGETVFHVWQCDSDMFSMLVHSCFVDDGNGSDKKAIIDENGCTIDSLIVPDLTYNAQNNLAYSEVSVFKFADKVNTYFQCAVSTCMISEGMCVGKTPPRCGQSAALTSSRLRLVRSAHSLPNSTRINKKFDDYTMDLVADKIVVLDLEETEEGNEERERLRLEGHLRPSKKVCMDTNSMTALTLVTSLSLFLSTSLLLLFVFRKRTSSLYKS